jgi:hypothetical protein
MSKQLEAVLMIAHHGVIREHFLPYIDLKREEIRWDEFPYGVLSGGQKAAVSWAYSVWTDGPVPEGWRDPFEGFGVMSRELQVLVLNAMLHRWS